MNAGRRAISPLYSVPMGPERPLRVVLAGPPQVPGWVREFHDLAAAHHWIECFALIAPGAALPKLRGVGADLRMLVTVERAMYGGDRGLALVPMPSTSGAADVASLPARITMLSPDLVLLLGPQGWARMLSARLTCGCWYIDASLADPRHAGLGLIGPMQCGEAATRMGLTLQPSTGAAVDLVASRGSTRAGSFLKQREAAFRKLPVLLLRALRRVASGQVANASGSMATLRLSLAPPTRAAGLRVLPSIARVAARSLTRRYGDQRHGNRRGWTLVVRQDAARLDPDTPALGRFTLLKAPRGWWADPCVLVAEGRALLFVEEMADPGSNKASIACVELVDGRARRLGIAVEEPGHLSFPQLFRWQGQWYMTLETGYDRRASLYQATAFPLGWRRVRDLVTGWVCVDPTLYRHDDGRWYLFVNVAENGNSTCDELFLFVADDLDAVFRPHPCNPIVSDVRRARMAGRLFIHNGRLLRPGQDCAAGYGKALVFNEVLELGPTMYRERTLSRFAPPLACALDGCHTYSADGGIEILDVLGRLPADTACLRVLDEDGPAPPAARTSLSLPRVSAGAVGLPDVGAAQPGRLPR